MSENRAVHPVATMCRVLGVSPSGYHAWTRRSPSRRAREDAVLRDRIVAIHAAAQGTYGAPRIHAELAAEGIHVGRKRVARLMRAEGLAGVSRRRLATTTVRDSARPAPDRNRRWDRMHSRGHKVFPKFTLEENLFVEQNVHQTLAISHFGHVLSKGRVVVDGTPTELAASDEVREAYFG